MIPACLAAQKLQKNTHEFQKYSFLGGQKKVQILEQVSHYASKTYYYYLEIIISHLPFWMLVTNGAVVFFCTLLALSDISVLYYLTPEAAQYLDESEPIRASEHFKLGDV